MPRPTRPKLKNCDARMVCGKCGNTLDVFWKDGDAWAGVKRYQGRDDAIGRRPLGGVPGMIPRHLIVGVVPDAVVALLSDPAMVVYRCSRACGELFLLDTYDIWRRCAENEGGSFAV